MLSFSFLISSRANPVAFGMPSFSTRSASRRSSGPARRTTSHRLSGGSVSGTSWSGLYTLCEECHATSLLDLIAAAEEAQKQNDLRNLIELAIRAPHWTAHVERVTIPVLLDQAG